MFTQGSVYVMLDLLTATRMLPALIEMETMIVNVMTDTLAMELTVKVNFTCVGGIAFSGLYK